MMLLVTYDVSTETAEGRRRLRQVCQACKNYGQRVQKSVFECWLTPGELAEVRATLGELLDSRTDRAHIFQLDPRMKRDFLGIATQPVTAVFLIV